MDFRVTVRYGRPVSRYHVDDVRAETLAEALRAVAEALPEEVAREGTLVEIRPATVPEERSYAGEEPA